MKFLCSTKHHAMKAYAGERGGAIALVRGRSPRFLLTRRLCWFQSRSGRYEVKNLSPPPQNLTPIFRSKGKRLGHYMDWAEDKRSNKYIKSIFGGFSQKYTYSVHFTVAALRILQMILILHYTAFLTFVPQTWMVLLTWPPNIFLY
jgi:hypothetical protein